MCEFVVDDEEARFCPQCGTRFDLRWKALGKTADGGGAPAASTSPASPAGQEPWLVPVIVGMVVVVGMLGLLTADCGSDVLPTTQHEIEARRAVRQQVERDLARERGSERQERLKRQIERQILRKILRDP